MNKNVSNAFRFLFILLCVCPATMFAQTFPVENVDEVGFVPIFNGENFDGWVGDPVYWSVVDGVMTGTVTEATLLRENSFIIWQGGQPSDFELKMDYRVSGKGNSGINYRSVKVETKSGNKYALKGYQLDIDGEGSWTGQNYEERGREFLALRGQATMKRTNERSQITGSLDSKDNLWNTINKEGWNEAHIIVRGNVMIHLINGKVMSVVIDDDAQNRTVEGLIGMQVHVGPPMTIEYKNIRLKELK
ncbi:MAG: DUF1080 domain-containing protein [Tannerellaceae bacterium]|jgi:hypothetical protein|nr:DUF1080 domain-containing protein [Tannerellaceae bacterium]